MELLNTLVSAYCGLVASQIVQFDGQKAFRRGEQGHFKCECTRPPQYDNQNPFRNQTSNNTECAMVPVGNSNQAGSSNTNNTRALVVQADENYDRSVQLGSGGSSGTACYAQVSQHMHVQNGDSPEDEGSSGYIEDSDEESSSSSEDGIEEVSSETIDADV
ncbi:hypothetical protein Hanom_Chr14g01279371 [Helianthus anomalus]